MPDSITDLEREQVAEERRHWVRICRACNNHCAFCLDSDVQDGTMLDVEEVKEEILRGLAQGATRLILSGGEASIHPAFLDLVRFGKKAGYSHVQTISNGRMFAYGKFTRQALDAGLDEITISLHGHTAELSDELTGVPGSFVQTVAGIRNAVASRRCIVSGDVVVNRRNVAHLRSILELFISLGVREFDILMVVPFGRAAPGEGRELLFDTEAELSHLHRALDLGRDPTLHIWTNRMDPALLEGYEHLIQDPHKLHDEVRGRHDILQDLVEGRRMRCAGDRCSHCFIRDLCHDMRQDVKRISRGVPDILALDVTGGPAPAHLHALLDRDRKVLWVHAHAVDAVVAVPGLGRARELWLDLDDASGLAVAVERGRIPPPRRLVVDSARKLGEALQSRVDGILVHINASTAPALRGIRGLASRKLLVSFPPMPTLRGAARDAVEDLQGALVSASADGYPGIPPCLSGAGRVQYEDHLDCRVVDREGRLDPDAFVDHFVAHLYRVKSLRCAACRWHGRCRGIPVNLVRARGLELLTPVG